MNHFWGPIIPVKWLNKRTGGLGRCARSAKRTGGLGRCAPHIAVALLVLLFTAGTPSSAASRKSSRRRQPVTVKQPAKPKAAGAAALLALARRELDQNQLSTAAEYAERAAKQAPELDDYSNFVRSQAQSRSHDLESVEKTVARILEHNPVSPLAGPAAALAVQADLDGDKPKDALDLIRKFYARIPQPQADFLLARAFQSTGDPAQAAEYFQRVYYGFPKSADSANAENYLNDLKTRLGESYPPPMPNAMLGRAMKLIDARDYPAARNELDSVIPKLGGLQRDIARVRLGEIDFFQRNYAQARSYLEPLQVDEGDADAERLDYLVRSILKLDHDANVDAYLDRLAAKYPSSPYRLDLLLTIGNQALVDNDTGRAMKVFSACSASFPTDSGAAWCHWRVAFQHYRVKEPGTADELRAFALTYPSSNEANASLYYLARLAQDQNDLSSARAWFDAVADHYPNTYYAVQARLRLQESAIKTAAPSQQILDFLKTIAWPERPRSPSFVPDRNAEKRVSRARLLHLAALDDWAQLELQYGAKNDGNQPYVYAYELARMADEGGSVYQSLRFVKAYAPGYLSIGLEDAPISFWHYAFPMPYRSALETYSRQNGLSPYLVAALIRQESEFNPTVISHANAYGLMQVVPSTGRALARQLRIRRFSPRELLTPNRNLQLGTLYYKQLLASLDGRDAEALAAYNAGKSRVDRWSSWGPFREQSEFIETIPFIETRGYVQFVLRNADVYRRIYETVPKAAVEHAASAEPKKPGSRKSVRKKSSKPT